MVSTASAVALNFRRQTVGSSRSRLWRQIKSASSTDEQPNSLNDSRPSRTVVSTLHDLVEINLQYLQLLQTERSLSPPIQAQLCGANVTALRAMASCPFPLFTVGWSDIVVWRELMRCARTEKPALLDATTPAERFLTVALCQAWECVRHCPGIAQVALGVNAECAAQLRNCALSRVLALAVHAVPVLAPVWARHAVFWPLLVQAGLSGEAGPLRRAKLLGRQLQAANALRLANCRR